MQSCKGKKNMYGLTKSRRDFAIKWKSISPKDRKVEIIPKQFKKVILRHIGQNDKKNKPINNIIMHREKNKANDLDPGPCTKESCKNEDNARKKAGKQRVISLKRDSHLKHTFHFSKRASHEEHPLHSSEGASHQELPVCIAKTAPQQELPFNSSKRDPQQEVPLNSSKRASQQAVPFYSVKRAPQQELPFYSSNRPSQQELPFNSSKRASHQIERPTKFRKRCSNSPFDATEKNRVTSNESHSIPDAEKYDAELIKDINVQTMDVAQKTAKNSNFASEVERLLCDIVTEENATPNQCNVNNEAEIDYEIEVIDVILPRGFSRVRGEESDELEIVYVKRILPHSISKVKTRDNECGGELKKNKVTCDEKSTGNVLSLQTLSKDFQSSQNNDDDDDFHVDVLRAESALKNIKDWRLRKMLPGYTRKRKN